MAAVDVGTDQLSLYYSWDTSLSEVLCVCVSREQNVLTGHESALKVWSWDKSLKATSSKEIMNLALEGNVTCICQFPNDTAFAVSMDQSILLYRYALVDNVITSLSLKDQLCFNEEEINQIDIHPKGLYICSCDDNGEVKVIDVNGRKLMRTLSRFHDTICATVKFSIKKPCELVSGGLDCTIGRWDFNRGRLLAHVSTKEEDSSDMLAPMINPPMVHSLDVFSSCHSFVCGLGDGRLVVYSLKAPKGMDLMCQTSPHLTSVACVHCIEIKGTQDNTTRYVVSIGNDRAICAHKLLTQVNAEGQIIHDLVLMDKVCGITKVNWIHVVYGDSCVFIFTADVSGSVSVYRLKC